MQQYRVVLPAVALLAGILWSPGKAVAQNGGGSLTVRPTSLTFNAQVSGSAPPSQALAVSASRRVSFTVSSSVQSGGTTWLSVTPSGTLNTNVNLTVRVSQTGLAAGTYTGRVRLTRNGNTTTVPVTFTVTAAGGGGVTVTPTSLTFSGAAGGAAPASKTLAVAAAAQTSFTASASGVSGSTTWLSVSPSGSLTTNRTLTVSANTAGLTAGTYNGSVRVVAGGITTTVPVALTVTGVVSGGVTVTPMSLAFSATVAGPAPLAQPVSVTATAQTSFTAAASIQSGASNWLSVSPSGSLTTNQTLSVSANNSALAAGTYNGTVTIVSGGITRTVAVVLTVNTSGGGGNISGFKLIGWNDLGMHCMDGKDYSVFAVLPPYNTIHTHLLSSTGGLVVSPTGYTITYQAINDPLTNTLNTTSIGKTNFWTYAAALGFGALAPDMGLKGFAMPGAQNTPRAMAFNTADNTWMAEGIPILNFADAPAPPYPTNYFPMMRLVAKNSSGTVLATTDIVLPTSDEMNCAACHSSTSGYAAGMPASGWVNNADRAKDVKLNILRKHDDRFKSTPLFQTAVAGLVGYNAAGLEATSVTKPILCDTCHASNALALAGVAGIRPLTTVMHGLHANVIDPATNQTMQNATTRESCYRCHPGPSTQCLRGAMGDLKTATGSNAIECQSCHSSMTALAVPTRKGWLDEPNCQACHTGTATSNSGQIVYTSVFSSGTTMRVAANQTFATNPNTPAAGISLYRFSKGHGGLQCEACHGSTHAEFATPIVNDNVQSTSLQGHSGMLSECASCHGTAPSTVTGGPHGLHPIGASWVNGHQNAAEGNATACQACHGTDYRGTILSKTLADRTMASRSFPKGTVIGCYSCHNGPGGG